MRGVLILGDEQVVLRDFPTPEPGPGQVVVRVKAAGICGSDLHNWYWRSRDELARDGADSVIPGHEAAGVVEAVGPNAVDRRVGDRVVVWGHCTGDCERCPHCQSCEQWFCRGSSGGLRQRPIHGGDAELLLAQDWQCLPLPASLDFAVGSVLACSGGTAYHSLRKLDVTESQTVAVIGAGPQGLAVLAFARALGARTIVAEPVAERLQLALQLGADAVVDPQRESVPQAVRELTEGRGADAVLECSGSANGQREAVEAARAGGRVGYIAYGALGRRREGTINPAWFIWKQLTLVGCSAYRHSQFAEVARFVVERRVPLADLVTHRYRLEEAAEAFRVFDGRRTGKVVLVPGS